MGKLTEKDVKWVVKNWDSIPDNFKENLCPKKYADWAGVSKEQQIVVLLVDRQRPSVASSYDFNEERVGINRFGEVIWGFDSGCSCPSPWDDGYPQCYKLSKDWHSFVATAKTKAPTAEEYHDFGDTEFDTGWSEEAKAKLDAIQQGIARGGVIA